MRKTGGRRVGWTDGWRVGRTDGRTDGPRVGWTDGDPDGHHHTIIRPVWRRAYKNAIVGLLPQRRLWTIELHTSSNKHLHSRSFRSNSFSNRTPYQIIADFSFVLSGHINPSLAFGYNVFEKWNQKLWPFTSHIHLPRTVRWSYLTIVYNRVIWMKLYLNSLHWLHTHFVHFLDAYAFVPVNSLKCEAALTHRTTESNTLQDISNQR